MDILRSGFLLLVVATSTAGQAGDQGRGTQAGTPGDSLYEKKDSFQETMLATRARYAAWQSQQRPMRQAVQLKPWHLSEDRALPVQTTVDLKAKGPDGEPLWTARPDFREGAVIRLGDRLHPKHEVQLFRNITARRPVTLTVGLGGGDHLDVWLNGTKLLGADSSLPLRRYGCAMVYDDTRVDQLLVEFPLKAGDNTLLVRLASASETSFYFSIAPEPAPRLWKQIRNDFPVAENALLELCPQAWFDAKGWLAATSSRLEEELLGDLVKDAGDRGAPIASGLDRLKQAKVAPSDHGWLDLCVRATTMTRLSRELASLRAAVAELGRISPKEYAAGEMAREIDRYDSRLQALAGERRGQSLFAGTVDSATKQLVAEIAAARRRMLVDANPLLNGAEIVFVRRHTYNSQHYYDDFINGVEKFGGNLCVLSMADGKVRDIASEKLAEGVFDRYDLSFDAKRIVFGYRGPREAGFRIHEIGVDGSGHRQITFQPEKYRDESQPYWSDDIHPCYLPDGRIIFSSSRLEHEVICHPNRSLPCTNLFCMNADGSHMAPLSNGALGEFSATMMEDGRVLYNRWEYVYKGIAAVQPLWTMRPDGSGSEEYYGNAIANPGVFWQARQVPGHTDKAVCIGCGHEPMGVGQVLLLDMTKNKRTLEPMTSLTPDVKTNGLKGIFHLRNGQWREDYFGPLYADPYPLSDKFFLVACNPDKRYNDPAGYGIYLLDAMGNRVLIHKEEGTSCWQPMVLSARRTPPVLPAVANGNPSAPAQVFLSDVSRGLDGVKPGTVKYVRVMEQIPRPWAVDAAAGDGHCGHLCISDGAHIWVAVMHGVVPVEPDGSAFFQVPAGKNIFFQALDENYMEVQRMRTFVNFRPGERRSCIGCHEQRTQSPAVRPATALARQPVQPMPQPGDQGPRALCYTVDVQPILDKHCVRCHGAVEPKGGLDLTGELTTLFNRSYENVMKRELVSVIREWATPAYKVSGAVGSMANVEATPPYTYGSHKSRFVQVLHDKEHEDVKLSQAELVRIVTWIDCGAPYYGSYFGKRNLKYKDCRDFRPVPKFAEACGEVPASPELTPVAAELVAHWRLGEGQGDVAGDASGHGHQGRIVGGVWTQGHHTGSAIWFRGANYVELKDLGTFETLSMAFWVRAETLKNTWNPLLFRDVWEPGALHLSLLADGRVNVALNGTGVIHQPSRAVAGDGVWHHVAVVLDTRTGGSVCYYIDGQRDRRAPLSGAMPLLLDSLRLGGWKNWQRTPGSNFHGALGDVRLYRGMLREDEVAGLAGKPVKKTAADAY